MTREPKVVVMLPPDVAIAVTRALARGVSAQALAGRSRRYYMVAVKQLVIGLQQAGYTADDDGNWSRGT